MLSLVGNTPMIRLNNIPKSQGFKCKIYAKCEFMNPTGSATDRTVKQLLTSAPPNLLLKQGDIVVGGPGDFCLSTAWLSAVGDLKPTVILEKSTPVEKSELISALKGRIIPRPGKNHTADDPTSVEPGSIRSLTNEVLEVIPGNLHLRAGISPSSLLCHYSSTGVEIKCQVKGQIDMIVCGAEAGGLIYGVSLRLRDQDPEHKKVVEGRPGQLSDPGQPGQQNDPSHKMLTSIGVDFRDNGFNESLQNEHHLPEWTDLKDTKFDPSLLISEADFKAKTAVTKWYKSTDGDSYFMSRRLVREEGLLVGPGAGAVLSAALKAIEDFGLKDKEDAVIVVVLNGSFWQSPRDYLSNSWMLKHGYFEENRMESLYWWWDMPVCNIKMTPTILIPESTSVEVSLGILESSSGPRAILLDSLDQVVGILELHVLKSLIKNNSINLSDTLIGTYSSGFRKIDCNASISELTPILQESSYGLIVQKSLTFNDEDEVPKTVEVVTGSVDQGDLTKFLLEIEKHHEDNYGIILSDGIPSCDWFRNPVNLEDPNQNIPSTSAEGPSVSPK